MKTIDRAGERPGSLVRLNLRQESFHYKTDSAPVELVSIPMGLGIEQFVDDARHQPFQNQLYLMLSCVKAHGHLKSSFTPQQGEAAPQYTAKKLIPPPELVGRNLE